MPQVLGHPRGVGARVGAHAEVSRTVRKGNTSRPSGTWLSPSRATRSGSSPWIARPAKVIVPFCGSITPETVLRIVVLPAPLAPGW